MGPDAITVYRDGQPVHFQTVDDLAQAWIAEESGWDRLRLMYSRRLPYVHLPQ